MASQMVARNAHLCGFIQDVAVINVLLVSSQNATGGGCVPASVLGTSVCRSHHGLETSPLL
jgi:hypothetical protein